MGFNIRYMHLINIFNLLLNAIPVRLPLHYAQLISFKIIGIHYYQRLVFVKHRSDNREFRLIGKEISIE